MLPVLGSRAIFPLLATVLLVLLNSTSTSATPVAVVAAGLSPLGSRMKVNSRPRPIHTDPDTPATGSTFKYYGNDGLVKNQGRIQQNKPIAFGNPLEKQWLFPILCVDDERVASCETECVPSGEKGSQTMLSLRPLSFSQLKTRKLYASQNTIITNCRTYLKSV